MNRILYYFLFCTLLSCTCPEKESRITKETFLYSVKESDSLYLDKYTGTAIKPEACVIFLFGGGFVGGQRDSKDYLSYFNTLAEAGYTIFAIDYRLGLKKVNEGMLASPEQFVSQLKYAIDLAVEDLYDATNYVLNRPEWNINPNRIILSGSSAGAISVLQAEYELVNNTPLAQKLPEGFNYAGVLSFAGAVLSIQGDLSLTDKTCPMMLFHGNADANVPYDKLELGDVGFYGSKHIANKLKEKGLPYYFYQVNNAAHEIANTPMIENLTEIKTFIEKFILKQQPLSIESVIDRIGAPELKKDFELNDYIITNFGK